MGQHLSSAFMLPCGGSSIRGLSLVSHPIPSSRMEQQRNLIGVLGEGAQSVSLSFSVTASLQKRIFRNKSS